MKHKLQNLLKHKLQWLALLAALLGVSQGAWGDNTVVSDGTYRLYFQFSGGYDWWNNSGCYHYAWVCHNGDAGIGIHKRIYKVGTTDNASTGNTTDYFYLELPTASNKAIDRIKLFRGKSSTNPADGSTTYTDESYNKTKDITISSDITTYNLITGIKEDNASCTQTGNYAIAPSSCSVEITGAQSGTGTQGDPYIVNVGEQYTLTLSAACDDGNLTKYYTFDNSNWSTTATKNVTPAVAGTTTYSDMKAKMGNGSGTVTYSSAVSASTIYVQAVDACTPPSAPTDVTATPSTICNGSSSTLSATVASGTLKWWNAETGGTQVGTNTNLSVSPSTTTVYWAEVDNGSCASSRVSVTVTVNALPTLSLGLSPSTVYPWDVATITASTTCTTSTLVWKLYQGASLISTGAGSDTYYTFEKTDDTHYTLKGISSSGSASSVTYTVKVDGNNGTCNAAQATQNVTISAAASEDCGD